MEAALIISGMALVTFLTRFCMLAVLSRELPSLLARWLSYVPIAIFTALVIPGLLICNGRFALGSEFWAGVVASLVGWRSRQVPAVILTGMVAYWLLLGVHP